MRWKHGFEISRSLYSLCGRMWTLFSECDSTGVIYEIKAGWTLDMVPLYLLMKRSFELSCNASHKAHSFFTSCTLVPMKHAFVMLDFRFPNVLIYFCQYTLLDLDWPVFVLDVLQSHLTYLEGCAIVYILSLFIDYSVTIFIYHGSLVLH